MKFKTLSKSDFVLLFFLGALIAWVAFFPMHSTDIFWNLKMGLDWVHRGLSPFRDHYSFTFDNQPLQFVCWPFQIICALFYSLMGATGLPILRAFLWLMTLLSYFVAIETKRTGDKVDIVLKALMGICLILTFIQFSEPGPDLGSFFLVGLCLLFVAEAQKKTSSRNLLKLVVLMWVWTNYHTSSVIGYVVISFFYFDWALDLLWRKKALNDWIHLLGWGLLTVAVGFLNHDLNHVLIAQLKFMGTSGWNKNILDFAPLVWQEQSLFVQVYVAMASLATFWLLYCKRWGEAALIIFFGFETFHMRRLLSFFILVSLPVIILWLRALHQSLGSKYLRLVPGSVGLALMSSFLVIDLHKIQPQFHIDLAALADFEDMVEPIKERGYKGHIFAPEEKGGALLFFFSPDLKVFIDGRLFVLYPLNFSNFYFEATTSDEFFKKELSQYAIDYVLAPLLAPDFILERAIHTGMGLDFVGTKNAILSQSGRFKEVTASFVHPECIKKLSLPVLRGQLELAKRSLPAVSPLVSFLEFAVRYREAQDKRDFLSEIHPEVLSSLQGLRLAAFLSEAEGQKANALAYYEKMPLRARRDAFEMARLLCDLRDCSDAEKILYGVSKFGIQKFEYVKAGRLFLEIQNKVGLKIMKKENLDQFKSMTAQEPDWCF